MRAIVWHEPERVRPGTWLYAQHPEWLLGPGPDGDNMLLNLGNPQAWTWVVEHFDGLIRQQGVDVYRQDFNIDPLAYWNMADPPGRRGITQIRHVTGLLAFWDELRQRHPDLLIDCCASGGRRNDLECMQRAVPLWRSDDNGAALNEQCHTYGIAFWLPYYGSGISPSDVYTLRSGMLPSYQIFLQVLTGMAGTARLAQRLLAEWRACAGNLLGDYYPLTPYSLTSDVWMAWQFDSPEAGTGVVQAFRREDSMVASMRLMLRGLDATATYELRNFDAPGVTRATGHSLMTSGLSVTLAAPAAATITYRQVVRA
jgi:alpha-galactosidase